MDDQPKTTKAKTASSSKASSSSFLVPVKSVGQVVDGTVVPSLYHRGGMWFSAVVSGERHVNILSMDTLSTVFSLSLPDGEVDAKDKEKDKHGMDKTSIVSVASRDDVTVVYTSDHAILLYCRADLQWTSKVTGELVGCESMFLFEDFLMAVSFVDGKVAVLSVKDGRLLRTVSVSSGITAVIHPNTYLNKMLFGLEDGALELWNVKTGEMVCRFDHDDDGAGSDNTGTIKNTTHTGKVTAICQSPDADIIAVARLDKTVTVMSIKDGSVMGRVRCAAVPTAIAFRHDSPVDDVQMVTSQEDGEFIIWSLKGKARPICRQANGHRGSIMMASLLTGQPILITVGQDDNAIKEWIIESQGREVRLLRSREGPHTAIRDIQFTNNTQEGDYELVCTSDDSEHVVSLTVSLDAKIRHTKMHAADTSMMVPVSSVQLSNCQVNLGWDDAVVLFNGQPFVRTMSKRKNANGRHLLVSSDDEPVAVAACSRCGHFAVIVSTNGLLSVFNLQSGLLKFEYQLDKSITPIMVSFDSVSRHIIVVGQTGSIIIISGVSSGLQAKVKSTSHQLDHPIRRARFHVDSNTAFLVSARDQSIGVFDVQLERVVRRLDVPRGIVNDLCVTTDSKWLLLGMATGEVLLWDLISGVLVGQHATQSSSIRSLTVSFDGQYVASVAVGSNCAQVWSFLPHHATATPLTTLTSSSSSPRSAWEWCDEGELMLTMSSSRFTSFINWHQLAQQNRPQVPVKKASTAPFFLSELASLKDGVDDSSTSTTDDDAHLQILSSESSLDDVKQFLSTAPVSHIYNEVVLGANNDKIIVALTDMTKDCRQFDRCLAIVTLLLRHSTNSNSDDDDDDDIARLSSITEQLSMQWRECHDLMHSCLNVIRHCRRSHHAH